MRTISLCLCKLVVVFVFLASTSGISLGAEYYQGKTIRFVVGQSAGGGYDAVARLIARTMTSHIPGNPTIIVENMPGAGALVAANYTYGVAKPDGLTVGIWNGALVLHQTLGDPAVKFDAQRLGWIGAARKAKPACAVMAHTGIKTFNDVLKSTKPIKMGGVGSASINDALPMILNKTVGTKFNVIAGYGGTGPVLLALQRREVDGICISWGSMNVTARQMLDANGDDKLVPVVIASRVDDPEVKHVPLIEEVIKGADNLATYRAWAAPTEFHTPFSVPPGTPKEQLKILRDALRSTLQDRALLATAAKSEIPFDYSSGEEIEKRVTEVLSISPKAKENLQFLLGDK